MSIEYREWLLRMNAHHMRLVSRAAQLHRDGKLEELSEFMKEHDKI